MKYVNYLLLLVVTVTTVSCGAYSFTGADTGDAKTYQVNYFQNNAVLIEPGLERDFTNALADLIQNQTNLSLVSSNGDLVYEGEITEYRISPTTATANNTAAQNRLTISVNVRFYNKKKEDEDFERKFSFYYDYNGSAQLVGSTKTTAFEEIFERITQDVFNASLANW
ncbi:LptE family protein [Bizionia paragorgiae]|uniref:Lipopolysaccharide-assembly n=1 Tax=Bizionia paragorgiae TaxID=283786 RepID=A0A1H3WCL9_BIZPA|nr:LptE family protein [Bizionia paragorgiae]MDX1271652.1 LptE family protein [Bizionia paragorgiae]SDZ84859.1 Lipopolysaccharide-assembly [Bizionia paragorgiae]